MWLGGCGGFMGPALTKLACVLRAPVTSDVITTWYQERAREIEHYSGLVGLGTGH